MLFYFSHGSRCKKSNKNTCANYSIPLFVIICAEQITVWWITWTFSSPLRCGKTYWHIKVMLLEIFFINQIQKCRFMQHCVVMLETGGPRILQWLLSAFSAIRSVSVLKFLICSGLVIFNSSASLRCIRKVTLYIRWDIGITFYTLGATFWDFWLPTKIMLCLYTQLFNVGRFLYRTSSSRC